MSRSAAVFAALLLPSLLLPALRPSPLVAQHRALPPVDTVAIVLLRLVDGTELTGRVVARDDSTVTVVTAAGLRISAPVGAIARYRVVRGEIVGGQFRQADPNTSRLFFAPTGRTVPGGSGYFADYYLFFPFVAYGATDRLTLAGGVSILPGASSQLVYLAPKVGIVQQRTTNIAVGALYITVPGEQGYAGAAYAVGTFGTEDNALTVVAGFPFANGERSREPGLLVGGETRISSRTKFLFEAWKLPGVSEVPAIFGMRFFGSRLSVDFGLVGVLGAGAEGLPFLPWVDFAVGY